MRLKNLITIDIASLKGATRYIIDNHYLHRGRAGPQIPYWILFEGERIGVILFAYPRMTAVYHGYKPGELIEFARMYIDPVVQGIVISDSNDNDHTLAVATCAIGKTLRRVRQDWHAMYPSHDDILACVSWADSEYHNGTIYKAANFEYIGIGKGGTTGSRESYDDYNHDKLAFIYRWKKPLRLAEQYREKRQPTHEQVSLF